MKRSSRRDQTGDHSILADGSNGAGARLRSLRIRLPSASWPGLRVAEQQDVVGRNGIARRKIREPPRHPDFVALKNSRIALDRLHQRAGFSLLGSGALAEAAAGQSRPELVDVLGRRREIVRRIEVGVQRQIGFDPLEPRDHAGEGAHMLAEACHRGPRRHGPVSAAGHDQLGAGAKLDRQPAPGAGPAASCCRRSDIAGGPPRNASRWSSPTDRG